MMIVATDAPLSDRNLRRLAMRAVAGLARTGAAFSNGSGDYAIAFSTAEAARRTPERRSAVSAVAELPNDRLSPLFAAAADATEEAIYNSLLMATGARSVDPQTRRSVEVQAIDIAQVRAVLAGGCPARTRPPALSPPPPADRRRR